MIGVGGEVLDIASGEGRDHTCGETGPLPYNAYLLNPHVHGMIGTIVSDCPKYNDWASVTFP